MVDTKCVYTRYLRSDSEERKERKSKIYIIKRLICILNEKRNLN